MTMTKALVSVIKCVVGLFIMMVVMSVAVEITSLLSDSSTMPSPVATRELFWTIISKCFP